MHRLKDMRHNRIVFVMDPPFLHYATTLPERMPQSRHTYGNGCKKNVMKLASSAMKERGSNVFAPEKIFEDRTAFLEGIMAPFTLVGILTFFLVEGDGFA